MTGFRNTSSASELNLGDLIERLNNLDRYGIERIETDESVPEGQFLINSERTLIRVHPSREAWVKEVLADDWEKRKAKR